MVEVTAASLEHSMVAYLAQMTADLTGIPMAEMMALQKAALKAVSKEPSLVAKKALQTAAS